MDYLVFGQPTFADVQERRKGEEFTNNTRFLDSCPLIDSSQCAWTNAGCTSGLDHKFADFLRSTRSSNVLLIKPGQSRPHLALGQPEQSRPYSAGRNRRRGNVFYAVDDRAI